MFDISFTELMVIALVGLLIIGPERMPKVARTIGHLLGRVQRYVSDVKADINREMQLEDLKKLQDEVAAQARGFERQVKDEMASSEAEIEKSILALQEDPPTSVPEVASAKSAATTAVPDEKSKTASPTN